MGSSSTRPIAEYTPSVGGHCGSAQAGRKKGDVMKKETFEKLKRSLEEAVEIERGQRLPARVTIREIPDQNVRKLRINIMLDEDIVQYFKQRAALPNAAPYQTQINQILRELIAGKRLSALPLDDQSEALAERIAEKVASRLRRARRKKPPEKGSERNA